MHAVHWVIGACVGLFYLAGCEDESKSASPPAESAAPLPTKPRAEKGASCRANTDCADGLGCAPDETCQTYKTIECRGRDQACKEEGRCSGSDRGCAAETSQDCRGSEICKDKGRCTAREGKCVAATDDDCKAVCKEAGRCTIDGDECIAATDDDCKEAEACTRLGKCVARQGQCFKKK